MPSLTANYKFSNEDYDDDDLEDSDEDPEGPWDDEEDPWDHNEDEWTPKLGHEYWLEGRFEQQLWEEDLTDHMNLLKIHDNRLGRTLYDDRGIHDEQLLTGEGPTRSKARDRAAMHAAGFVHKNGL